jgi:DNA invertase Pin-like site-specific DNA recombinase
MKVRYARISTLSQNLDRQLKDDLKVYSDKCSGSIKFEERPSAKRLLKDIDAGKVNHIVTDSIDRLGRNTKDILHTIEYFEAHHVQLESEKEGLKLFGPDGKVNPTTKLTLSIMSSLAEFERQRILERTKEGREIAKLKGKYLGRKPGSHESPEKFLAKHQDVIRELGNGESIRRVAKFTGKSPVTVQKVKGFLVNFT